MSVDLVGRTDLDTTRPQMAPSSRIGAHLLDWDLDVVTDCGYGGLDGMMWTLVDGRLYDSVDCIVLITID